MTPFLDLTIKSPKPDFLLLFGLIRSHEKVLIHLLRIDLLPFIRVYSNTPLLTSIDWRILLEEIFGFESILRPITALALKQFLFIESWLRLEVISMLDRDSLFQFRLR
jgi:hypothetical protein